jgi:hypothetical protein
MSEPTPLRIRPKLYQEMKDEMPEIFTDTTTWGNYLLRRERRKPTDTKRKKRKKGRFSILVK